MISAIIALAIGLMCWVLLSLKDRMTAAAKPQQSAKHPPITVTSSPLPDYGSYQMSNRERWLAVAGGGALLAVIGYLFYGSVGVAALVMPAGVALVRVRAEMLKDKRLHMLRIQFKQALYAVASSLGAGKSVEQAFADAAQDMRMLYPQGTSLMIEELDIMLRKLQLGGTIEAAIADFSRRSGLEDAMNFADVFSICKRTGGNLVDIVRRTSTIIGEKLEIEQDIAVMLAQKRFESRVLLAAPLAIVAILRITAEDYMAPLYSGMGRITMTAALLSLMGCFWLTKRLMRIRI